MTAARTVTAWPNNRLLSRQPPGDDVNEAADTRSCQQHDQNQEWVQDPCPLSRSLGLRGRLSLRLISSALMNCSSGNSVGASRTTRPSVRLIFTTTPQGSSEWVDSLRCWKYIFRAKAIRRLLSTRSQRGVRLAFPPAPAITKEGGETEIGSPEQSDEPTIGLIGTIDEQKSVHLFLLFNHAVDDWSENQFHGKSHFAAVHHDAGGTGHERVVNHV